MRGGFFIGMSDLYYTLIEGKENKFDVTKILYQ